MHQLFNEQGEILSRETFQYQCNVNINYLDYYSIISAFPQHWKRALRDKHNNNNNDTAMVQHTPLLALTQKQHVCKYVYSDMVAKHSRDITTIGYRKWKIYFSDDLDVERWTNAFIIMYRSVLYTKIQALQFKMMHFTLFTRENFHKWGIVESDLCVFCHEDLETLPYVMIECEVIKIFLDKYLQLAILKDRNKLHTKS